MNEDIKKKSRERAIAFGFFAEVMLFLWSGIAFANKQYIFFGILYVIAGLCAYFVGLAIEKNAIENYKWGLKEND